MAVVQAFSAGGVNGTFQVLLKHLAIEQQETAKGLVLRRGGNVLTDGQMGEKGLDFGDADFTWVLFIVEQDVVLDPGDAGLFGADGVVFPADSFARLVEAFL